MTSDATLIHGPCTATGTTVRSVVEAMGRDQILPPDVVAGILARLDFGKDKYGADLCEDWPEARIAFLQEILDAIAYAIAGGRRDLVVHLVKILELL